MAHPVYVIGHQQPDTDTICSALAYARVKKAQGVDVVPARAGKMNPETRFVLDRWDAETPTLIDDAASDRLILVDHNDTVRPCPARGMRRSSRSWTTTESVT